MKAFLIALMFGFGAALAALLGRPASVTAGRDGTSGHREDIMFKAKSQDGLKMWNQSEVIAVLDTVDSTVTRLLGYLPQTLEGDAYKAGVADMLETIGGMFGLRREQ
jgi:hypothetical protein